MRCTHYWNHEDAMKDPAILQRLPHPTCSPRYTHIRTADLVGVLADHGYSIVAAQTALVRKEGRQGYQQHLVHLRRQSQEGTDHTYPEIVLRNAHDCTRSIELLLGAWRLYCLNRAIVGSTFASFRFRHTAIDLEAVSGAVIELTQSADRLLGSIDRMRTIELDPVGANTFAYLAHELRPAKIAPKELLTIRRKEDKAPTVWNIFNRIQENILRGGIRTLPDVKRRSRTRSIRSIDETVRVNRGLWDLAESFAAH